MIANILRSFSQRTLISSSSSNTNIKTYANDGASTASGANSPTTNSCHNNRSEKNVTRSSTHSSLSYGLRSLMHSNSSLSAMAEVAMPQKLDALDTLGFTCDAVHPSVFGVPPFHSHPYRDEHGGNQPESFPVQFGMGLYEFDASHFHAFGSIEPVGLVIITVDPLNASGHVRTKMGIFRTPIDSSQIQTDLDSRAIVSEVLTKFIMSHSTLWSAVTEATSTNTADHVQISHSSTESPAPPNQTVEPLAPTILLSGEHHVRSTSVQNSISDFHTRPTADDLAEWKKAFDSYFQSVRYSDEISHDQLRSILASFGKSFEYKPSNFIVIDVYDFITPESLPLDLYGIPAEDFIQFKESGHVIKELGLTAKRPPPVDFKFPKRPTEDNNEKRKNLFDEIQENEHNFQENLKMMMMVYDMFDKRASSDSTVVMSAYHVPRCFPRVDHLLTVSNSLLENPTFNYLRTSHPNQEEFVKVLSKYLDEYEPVLINYSKNSEFAQGMLASFWENKAFQAELNCVFDALREKYGKQYKDLQTLITLPVARLTYLRLAITHILEVTPVSHPLNDAIRNLALKIHMLSRKVEQGLDETETQGFLLNLAIQLDHAIISNVQRVYMNDYIVRASPLNWEFSSIGHGIGQALMLFSDIILVLVKIKKGESIIYRVQRDIKINDILWIDCEDSEIIFGVKALSADSSRSELILRFTTDDEKQCQRMYQEISHVWIANNWARSFWMDRQIGLHIMQRDDLRIYYRILKSTDPIKFNAGDLTSSKASNVAFVAVDSIESLQSTTHAIADKYVYIGVISNTSQSVFDFAFRVRARTDKTWTQKRVGLGETFQDFEGTVSVVNGVESLRSALFTAAKVALIQMESPESPEAVQKRKLYLANCFHNFPSISFGRRMSLMCRGVPPKRLRSRKQSAASMFGADDDGRSIGTNNDRESVNETSPERPYSAQSAATTRHIRRSSVQSVESTKSVFGTQLRGPGIGIQTGPRKWFQRKSPVRSPAFPMPKIEYSKLSDYELLKTLCREIECREEKRAYNNASVAVVNSDETVFSNEECIALAKRSKSASGFVLALRILLGVPKHDTTFAEQYLIPRHVQKLMLDTPKIKDVSVLKKICVEGGLCATAYFVCLFEHLHRIESQISGTTSSTSEMAGFLASSLFPKEASKDSPFEIRSLCHVIVSSLIDHFPYITNGQHDYTQNDVCNAYFDGEGSALSPPSSIYHTPDNQSNMSLTSNVAMCNIAQVSILGIAESNDNSRGLFQTNVNEEEITLETSLFSLEYDEHAFECEVLSPISGNDLLIDLNDMRDLLNGEGSESEMVMNAESDCEKQDVENVFVKLEKARKESSQTLHVEDSVD
ncbi:hypothetical protein BC830DRAFT_1093870 [Chytriomyces sp. MP71]|nr:hypothetical protein BC830DRAFT_1093870 [Chytriomyces sp. MP71]